MAQTKMHILCMTFFLVLPSAALRLAAPQSSWPHHNSWPHHQPTQEPVEVAQYQYHNTQESDDCTDLKFLHIPKNAGMAVEQAGSKNGWVWGWKFFESVTTRKRTAIQSLEMPDGSKCPASHVPPHMIEKAWNGHHGMPNPYKNGETFCVSRNPYSRAISEYMWVRDRYQAGKVNGAMNEFCKGCSAPCSKKGLNVFLKDIFGRQINGSTYFLNRCHMVPQVDMIWGPNDQQWCKHILPLETLSDSLEALLKKSNCKAFKLEHTNSHDQKCRLDVHDLDHDTKIMLEQVYQEDFQRLGYSLA